MPDGSLAGGYLKIAAVACPDLRRLAQARRSETIRFRAVEWEQAHEAARDAAAHLASLTFEEQDRTFGRCRFQPS